MKEQEKNQINQFIVNYNQQKGTSFNHEDIENYKFLNSIVAVLTGYNIVQIAPDKAVEMTQKCLSVFETFIESYMQEKYGKVQNMRYKALKFYPGDSVLHKFKELGGQIDEAVVAFASQAKLNFEHQNV